MDDGSKLSEKASFKSFIYPVFQINVNVDYGVDIVVLLGAEVLGGRRMDDGMIWPSHY